MPEHTDGSGRKRPNGALEADILAALHGAGTPLTAGELVERLNNRLSYSTVVTVLTRLHIKQLLSRAPRGRAYAYTPIADEPGLAARRMQRVLDELPDRQAVLARFVDNLSAADENLLRRLLGPDLDRDR
ncbi:Predicted transcriptional regulator [Streptomyces sp. DvalAA-14]|uniref:BlaI/MecI/CopY family transcriptional regulator n=1 Tax=unclassified Streptomyces TaxID=2593676 RepID=UPI00081B04FC|nr:MULTISPECIES: BlaI/MecI/CopY family transcriptional regulator [unclassified Streptomyces]MYS20304.1 BlaI/MecI/CopY family transcriptional regulator [Streptomyces sp. SID4948]SCD65623.1 Predicted transcriptional regulator [Streptomyces sp. DvalAA-14]